MLILRKNTQTLEKITHFENLFLRIFSGFLSVYVLHIFILVIHYLYTCLLNAPLDRSDTHYARRIVDLDKKGTCGPQYAGYIMVIIKYKYRYVCCHGLISQSGIILSKLWHFHYIHIRAIPLRNGEGQGGVFVFKKVG